MMTRIHDSAKYNKKIMHSYTHKLSNHHPLVSASLSVKHCVINSLCSLQNRKPLPACEAIMLHVYIYNYLSMCQLSIVCNVPNN